MSCIPTQNRMRRYNNYWLIEYRKMSFLYHCILFQIVHPL